MDETPEDWAEVTTVMMRSGFAPAIIGSSARRTWYLVVVEGAEPGRRIRLGPTPLTLGRAHPAEVELADTEISRQHCRVHVDLAEGIVVSDLGSTNGTFVDGCRIAGSARLGDGALLQLGSHVLRCERLIGSEAERVEELSEDLRRARDYALALLPAPVTEGPIRADWVFVPSSGLAGDGLGYQWLDERQFAVYLVDVSGHGAGAALHGASILNVLRHRTLPETDFSSPADVVRALNASFLMDDHAGMFFCAWYGVFDLVCRTLTYCSGGHHPGFLRVPGREALEPLITRNPLLGAVPDYAFAASATTVAPGSTLYLFSDGVFDVVTRDGRQGALADLFPLLLAGPHPRMTESERLHRAVRERARPGPFDDDFSVVAVTFL